MTVRVLRGKRSDGSLGFDISKPGYDVRSTDKMHMAFSSDLKIPRVVISGQGTVNPTNGYRAKDTGIPGGQQTAISIPYGMTLPVMPVVVAIGKCSSWLIPLALGNRNIIPGLWGQYISPIFESFAAAGDLTYGTKVNHGPPDADSVSESWCACQFRIQVSYSYFTLMFNGSSALSVKYLVLRYP